MSQQTDDALKSGEQGAINAGKAAGKAGKLGIKLGKKAGKAAAEGAAEAVAAPEVFLVKVFVALAIILLALIIFVVVYGTTGPGMDKTDYLTANNASEWNQPEEKEEDSAIYDKQVAVEETAALIQIIHEEKEDEKQDAIDEIRAEAQRQGCDPDLTEQNMIDDTGTSLDASVSASGIKESEAKTKTWKFLKANGYSDEAAAGIMGNIQAESHFDPGIEETTSSPSKGFGLCQWTFGRRTKLESFAKSKGKPASNIDVQLDFLLQELNTSYKSCSNSTFKRSTDIEYTTRTFLTKFEIPANIEGTYPVRLNYARQVYKTYKGMKADGAQTASNKTTVTASSAKVNLATKIVNAAREYSWPYKTDSKKWKVSTGSGYNGYVEAYKKSPAKTEQSINSRRGSCCCHFTKFILYKATGKSLPNTLQSCTERTINKFEKYGFSTFEYDGKESSLQAGDIIVYMKKDSATKGHAMIYLGNDRAAEAQLGNSYPHIIKLSDKKSLKTRRYGYVIRPNGGAADTTSVLSSEQVRANICSWAKKIAADDSYKYYKVEVNSICPVCHPGKGKKGWQCIGFVSAAYHHNGVKSVKCAMDGLGNNNTLTSDTIESWRKRNGKEWDRIENPKMSQLVAGDVLICFKGSKYQHTALYVGDGMICDAVNEETGIKHRKYSSLGSKVKYAYRYNGTAIGEATGDGAGYATREDFDLLAAYSVSVGNSEMEVADPDEANQQVSSDGVLDRSTYTDITGKAIPLYWFGKKAGTPNYQRDLKSKLKKGLFFNSERAPFYTITYEKTSSGAFSYGTATVDGKEVRYLKSTLKERDVTEEKDGFKSLAESAFGVVPKDEYMDSGNTNKTAIKGIGEQSYNLLGDEMMGLSSDFATSGGVLTDPLNNKGVITSPFGYRESPGGIGSTNHKGIDIGAPSGTKIYAAAAGTVTLAGWNDGYGYCTIINHGGGYSTLYGHQRQKPIVKVGQTVQAGQLIGYVGTTGNSTGPHLHFEYMKNGKQMDPSKLIGRKK